MKFLNNELLSNFSTDTFNEQHPFPWYHFHQVLTPEGFTLLHEQFPSLALFEKHTGMERVHGQRPHNRYYLAYEQSIYGAKQEDTPGEVKQNDLPEAWQSFMTELQTSPVWKSFAERMIGMGPLTARYAWHVGVNGSEVSPHRDADDKLGTHIFYFNTAADWDMAWGGATLALGGKKTGAMNPDFTDFAEERGGDICDNRSFLFKNTAAAWHGVRTLSCPDGSYRRLFNVILQAEKPEHKGLGSRMKQMLGGKR